MTAVEAQVSQFLKFLCDELRAEIKAQGHEDTGELLRSIRYEVKLTGDKITGAIFAAEQIDYTNRKLKFRWISRAQIKALTAWWKRKGLAEKEAKGAAFATAFKHQTEGMPTVNSYAFSKNNRRLGQLQHGIDENLKDWNVYIKFGFDSLYLRNLITNANLYVKNGGNTST